jgi:hypothetical protein
LSNPKFKNKEINSSRTAIFLHKTYADYYNLATEFISRIEHAIIDDLNMEVNETPTLINIQPDPPEDEEEEPFQNLIENHPEYDDSNEDIPNATITAK